MNYAILHFKNCFESSMNLNQIPSAIANCRAMKLFQDGFSVYEVRKIFKALKKIKGLDLSTKQAYKKVIADCDFMIERELEG